MTNKPHTASMARMNAHKQHEPGRDAKAAPKAKHKDAHLAKGRKAKDMMTHQENPMKKGGW